MAYTYGPSSNPLKCRPVRVILQSVRANVTAPTIDVVLTTEDGRQTLLRMSRNEAFALYATIKDVLLDHNIYSKAIDPALFEGK